MQLGWERATAGKEQRGRKETTQRQPAASLLVLEVLGGFGPDFSSLAPGLVPLEQTRNRGRVTPLAPRILSTEVQGAAGGRSPGPADFTGEADRCRRGASTVPRFLCENKRLQERDTHDPPGFHPRKRAARRFPFGGKSQREASDGSSWRMYLAH